MATLNDWIEGTRVRTIPASISPVIVGASIAFAMGSFSWGRTLLAVNIALFLQLGVNLANDYSDGIRGTDEYREGPPRLTNTGTAQPHTVLAAALTSLGIACVLGVILVWISGHWWLLAPGAAALLAAWFYTGGKHPYGYAGLGEVFVLLFFGYMATLGTVYTQAHSIPPAAWPLATGVGLVACALLMVNNIRDIPSDKKAGKRTLAVLLGHKRARWSYYGMLAIAVVLASMMYLWGYHVFVAMLGMLVWVIYLSRPVITGATGHELLPTLRNTGIFELVYALLICAGFVATTLAPQWTWWSLLSWVILAVCWIGFLVVELVNTARVRAKKKEAKEALIAEQSPEKSSEGGTLCADNSQETPTTNDDENSCEHVIETNEKA